MISRLLKEAASVLLAAKVLVLSRLLHTKLSQRPQPCPYLETLRRRLASLRRRLLAKVDRTIKKVDQSRDILVDAMCAFALATSSSPMDVLRHYHHVRLEAIREQKGEHDIKSSISRSLKIYVNTLKDTRAVIPGQLPQALGGLKSAPLLEKADMLNLIELNLDLYKRNLGDDIRNFTPYIRLENLQGSDLEDLLEKWAQQAFSSLLDNVRDNLKEIEESHQLVALRTEVFQLWYSNQQYVTGIASTEVVDELRDVFNAQWSSIIKRQTSSLIQVSSTVLEIFRDEQDSVSDDDLSLWAPSMFSLETANGAKYFREALKTRLQGRSGALNFAVNQYARWTKNVDVIDDSIQTASAIKWADDLNDIEEDYDILNKKQKLLSEDDPRTIRKELSESVKAAFNNLQESLQSAADDLGEQDRGRRAALLLRLWREIRQHLPKSYQNMSLGLDAIGGLHRLIARVTARMPLERGKLRARNTYTKSSVPGRLLWEGDPPLPRMPSPWAFRLLRELSSAMADVGSDIWSRQATETMKQHLRVSLASHFHELTETEPHTTGPPTHEGNDDDSSEKAEDQESSAHDDDDDARVAAGADDSQTPVITENNDATTLQNGHAQSSSSSSSSEPPSNRRPSPEIPIQRLFDVLYLANATAPKETQEVGTAHDPWLAMQASAAAGEKLDLAPEPAKRMRKAAEEYWKRTSLLFGLLA